MDMVLGPVVSVADGMLTSNLAQEGVALFRAVT